MARKTRSALAQDLQVVLEQTAPGTRLPAERELALQLGCSRQTLRLGLAALEAEGRIWRGVGQGTFCGPRPRHLPLRDSLLIEGATPADLMQARLLLEPQVAAEAARRADPADVALLRDKVAQGRLMRDRPGCEAADDAFHRALAGVSRNPVLMGFLAYLSGTRRRVAWQREWERVYRRLGVAEFTSQHSDQHAAIVEAVAAHDPEAASAAMRAHLETIRAAMEGEAVR